MAKYLYQASYVGEGFKGLLAEGATSRVDYIKELVTGLGGTIEAFYFSFGDDDGPTVFADTTYPTFFLSHFSHLKK